MADDDMLLNFNFAAVEAAPLPRAHTSIEGGRWTARLKAKRATKNRPTPIEKPIHEFNVAKGVTETEGRTAPPKSQTSQSLKRKRSEAPERHPPLRADGTFVSSLWTGNPESTTIAETQPESVWSQEPSNAPLSDGSSTFTTVGLSPTLANHLTNKLGLNAPTAIQRSAIPGLLSSDSDAFIQAETGSGKTLTYLLPIVDRIMRVSATASRQSGLFAIVLAPTRELSRQIFGVLQTLIHCQNGPHWIVPGQIIGGEKKKSEKARIRKGMNILVATPGRLLDHLETTENLKVDAVRWLILDEGDRFTELGFEETIMKVLDILEMRNRVKAIETDPSLPRRRVTVLCSATMKTNVQTLGERSLKDALYIKAEKEEGSEEEDQFSAPAQLRQSFTVVPSKLRLVGLTALLKRAFIRHTANPKVMVFFSCTDSVDFHFEVFSRKEEKENPQKPDSRPSPKPTIRAPAVSSAPCLSPNILLHKLHGALAQPVRTATLASFTKATGPTVLFCTDVAARGLDLPNVDLVVQFDPPFSPDDHLHRIGRTARAGRDGRAVIFLLPGPEEGYVETVLKKGIQESQLVRTDLDDVIEKGFGSGGKEKRRDWEDKATEWQLQVERWVMDNPKMKGLACKAWLSHIRAYTTHVGSEKSIFNHKHLHYGHMAKCFGLRDPPTSINMPGASSGKQSKSAKGSGAVKGKRKLDLDGIGEVGGDEARKMRKAARMMERNGGLSSEFNIG